ncbi:MAG: hypothetical protein AAF511_11015 [Pseudomonadota bacterium]
MFILGSQRGVDIPLNIFNWAGSSLTADSSISTLTIRFDQNCRLVSEALSEHPEVVVALNVGIIASGDDDPDAVVGTAEKALKDKDLFKADALLKIAGHLGNPIWALVEAPELGDLDHLSASDLNGGGREVVEGAEQDGAQSGGAQKVNDFHGGDVGLGPLADKASAA